MHGFHLLRSAASPIAIRDKVRWQLSLRSLIVLTTMTAMVVACWRWFSELFSDLLTYQWVTIATISSPFFLAGLELRLRSHCELLNLLKCSVVVAAVNTAWGYMNAFFLLARSSSNSPDWDEVFGLGMRAALVWSFLLPISLSLVASAVISSETHGRIAKHFAAIAVITANLLLLYCGTTFLFETPTWQIEQWLSLLYKFLLSVDSRP